MVAANGNALSSRAENNQNREPSKAHVNERRVVLGVRKNGLNAEINNLQLLLR